LEYVNHDLARLNERNHQLRNRNRARDETIFNLRNSPQALKTNAEDWNERRIWWQQSGLDWWSNADVAGTPIAQQVRLITDYPGLRDEGTPVKVRNELNRAYLRLLGM